MNNYKNLLDRHHKYLRYLLVLSLITFVILFVWVSTTHAYDYRKLIEIHNSQVSGSSDLDNFPVLVSIQNDSDLQAGVTHANGYDITFRAFDGTTVLDHEIEKWDGATGTLVAWVRLPTVYIGTDTKFYLYYGDSSVSSPTENPSGVWDSNYMGVWHLKEEAGGTGTVDLYQDSTSYNNHGDDYVSATGQDGQLDGGQQFDGTDDYVNCGNNSNLNVNYITIEFWLKVNSWVSDGGILAKGTSSTRRYWIWTYGGAVSFEIDAGGNYNGAWNPTAGQWEHLVLTYDGSNVITYRNGGIETNTYPQATGTIDATTEPLLFGDIPPYNHADVNIDEMRISDTARTAGWIGTSYTNQNTPDVFYRVNSEDYIGGGNQTPTVDAGSNQTIILPASADLSDASASDSDGPSSLTYTWTKQSGPGTVTFSPNNTVLNPTASFSMDGTYVLELSVYDGAGTGADTVTITANPVGSPDLTEYSCNMKITMDNTKVSGSTDFTDFPVLISLTDDSLKDTGCGFVTSSTGDDIIFVDSSKTIMLDHEIEKYDNTTGEVNAWVRIPSLSATSNTDIYMYYGNSNVTSPQENPTGVWDANYAGVWHLKEDAATVPPTTFEVRVAADYDDAEEDKTDGAIDRTSSDLELIEESNEQEVGMRFLSVTIPPGATITNAYVEFTVDETPTATTNLTFWGEDADNPLTFSSSDYDITDRTKTSASVAWSNIPVWDTAGETKLTPNIKTIIQEIVDRGGWASGNAMVIIVTGTGERTVEAYDGVPASAPLLHVEYATVADFHLDSTSNANDGIPNGNTLTASGKIDGAQDFDGNDYVESPDSSSLDLTSQVTLSAWIRPTSTGSYDRIVGKSHSSAAAPWTMYGLLFDNANHLRAEISESLTQNAVDGTTVVPLNAWTYATVTYDGSNIRVYFNGSEDATPTALSGSIDTNNVPLSIGRSDYNSDYFNGTIDEVRVSNVARSADWIQTEYNNQNSPSSFYNVVKTCPDTTPQINEFTCSIPITIDSSKVSGTSDLINFPVLITLTNTSLKNTANCGYVQNINGYDIIFSDSTQTIQLDHEIEKYDSAAGELVAWVRVPTLKWDENTVINIHFGHSSVCGSQENPAGVWDSNYAAVWHLEEDPSGAAPQTLDSTSNDNDGTSNGSMTTADLVDGKIGKGIDFDGSNDWIEMANSTSLDITGNAITLSAWVKMTAGQSVDAGIINKSYSNNYNYMLNVQSSEVGDFRVKTPSGTTYLDGSTTLNVGQWYFLYGIYNGATAKVYLDGVEDGSDIRTGNIESSGAAPVVLGRRRVYPTVDDRFFTGLIDEVRISNVARSTDWMITEYNNQSDPSSFYSVGSSSCFLGGFSCNRKITIPQANVSGSSDLSNFPLLIEIENDCNLRTTANGGNVQKDNGWDIIFTNSAGTTQLDHELVSYDKVTGDLVAWVRVPTLSTSSDTDIYMYYGNSAIDCDPSNSTGVWDSNYKGVWHLDETSGTHFDSTATGNDATPQNGVSQNATGKIGGADDFDGSNDYVYIGRPANGSLDFDELTDFCISAWFNADSITSGTDYLTFVGQRRQTSIALGIDELDGGTIYFRMDDSTFRNSDNGVVVGEWNHVGLCYDFVSGTIGNIYMYVNGVAQATNGLNAYNDMSPDNWNIGREQRFYDYFDGIIDEVRISDTVRSADWFKTSYDNQSDPSSFYQMSSDSCGGQYGFNFTYCKKITVDNTQVSGSTDFSNFPLLVNITNNDLRSVANGGRVESDQGDDIIFRTSGCSKLDHEIESYDPTTGTLVAWVRIPTLSYNSDTEVYMYYGDSSVDCPTENPTAVWDSNYAAVWHLKEDPSGTAPQSHDSTANDNDGTSNGSMTLSDLVDGEIGKGIEVDGTDDWIQAPHSASLDITGDQLTLSAWVKMSAGQTDDVGIILKSTDLYEIHLGIESDERGNFRVKTPTPIGYTRIDTTTVLQVGQWYYLTGTYDGATPRIYLDGTQENSDSRTGNINATTEPVLLGRRALGDSRWYNGAIDEARISNVARSADWIMTEYSNQSDPGNFYTVGSCFEQTTTMTEAWEEDF